MVCGHSITVALQHFSEFSEAYVVPGDIVTKGADFLAEAERLKDQGHARLSLASLQGILLLYERFVLPGVYIHVTDLMTIKVFNIWK